MPRIVKASRLKISHPTTITPIELELFMPATSELAAAEELVEAISDPAVDAKEEAEAILRETEAMVRELLDAGKNQGEDIVKQAKQEAEQIIAQAQAQRQTWQDEAYREGYQAGYTEGSNDARNENENLLKEAKLTVEGAYEEKRRIIASTEGDILELAISIAHKIIGMELVTNNEAIQNLVKSALNKVCDPENVTVKVNPIELEQVLADYEKLKSSANVGNLQILGDTTVTPGGCLVETNSGNVDGRLERRVEEVEDALREVRSNE